MATTELKLILKNYGFLCCSCHFTEFSWHEKISLLRNLELVRVKTIIGFYEFLVDYKIDIITF